MTAREIIVALAIKNKGDWNKIYQDIMNKAYPTDDELQAVVNYSGKYITMLDDEYPQRLKETQHPPFVLFYEGDIELLKNEYTRIGIGTSKTNIDSQQEVLQLLLDSQQNCVYVLGDSKCDTTAQVLATGNKTIGVLPYGIDQAKYKYDLVLSEYPTGVQATQDNIYTRYRVMSGITSKTVIVSCRKHSGTALLIHFALDLGQDVYVIPLNVISTEFINNSLIGDGAIPLYKQEILLSQNY